MAIGPAGKERFERIECHVTGPLWKHDAHSASTSGPVLRYAGPGSVLTGAQQVGTLAPDIRFRTETSPPERLPLAAASLTGGELGCEHPTSSRSP